MLLRCCRLCAPARPLFESAEKARELRALMDKEGLRCACYSVSVNVLAENMGEGYDQSAADALKQCADMAKILGSPFLHHTLTIDNLSVLLAENLARDCAYMLEEYPEN